MKKGSFWDKIIFFINSLIAFALLFSYFLPYISPKSTPGFTILSLAVPVLFLINLLFAIYWIVRLKRQFILSIVIIVLGFGYIGRIYKFSEKKTPQNEDLKVMSYNVRMFNFYGWNPKDSIDHKTYDFINEKKPDILSIQEFFNAKDLQITYPYQYIRTRTGSNKFGLAIYSNYPIINSGSFDFKDSGNNIIFADMSGFFSLIKS